MNKILEQINNGESLNTEFKTSFQKEVIEPIFEEFVHGFRVTVFKEKLNEPLTSINNKTTQETTQEVVHKLSTKDKIIKAIENNNKITRDELAIIVGVSANAVKQHLANLKKDAILKRIGSTKSGYWEINNG